MDEGVKKILVQFAEDTIKAVKLALVAKSVNASGKLSDSLRYELDEEGLSIFITGYGYFVEYGRKPGGLVPVASIRKWIDTKGIVPKGKISKDSLAWAIAKSIEKKGTLTYISKQPKGILSEVTSQANKKRLIGELMPGLVRELTSDILKSVA
jgi:hypothetical protein